MSPSARAAIDTAIKQAKESIAYHAETFPNSKPKQRYVLLDSKLGEYIVREIKISGKPLVATVYADGTVKEWM